MWCTKWVVWSSQYNKTENNLIASGRQPHLPPLRSYVGCVACRKCSKIQMQASTQQRHCVNWISALIIIPPRQKFVGWPSRDFNLAGELIQLFSAKLYFPLSANSTSNLLHFLWSLSEDYTWTLSLLLETNFVWFSVRVNWLCSSFLNSRLPRGRSVIANWLLIGYSLILDTLGKKAKPQN